MKLKHTNIFSNIPTSLPNELFETLLVKETLKIERIVSQGHSTPASDWYDQAWDEWVLLLQGHAEIGFGDDNQVNLKPAITFLFLPISGIGSNGQHQMKTQSG